MGAGELYKANKDFFRGLDVDAILIDSPYPTPAHIDGIPAYTADDFLRHESRPGDYTYITFILASPLPRIKLHTRYGVANSNIHSVTSAFSTRS